jgi:alpha-N-acetylglucosamine transferase
MVKVMLTQPFLVLKASLRLVVRAWYLRRKTAITVATLTLLWLLLSSRRQPPLIDPEFGLIRNTTLESRYAIATFLTGGNKKSLNAKDLDSNPYNIATRVLAYQLLHAEETRCNASVDFVVLVTPNVPKYTRDQLTADGAVVVEAKDIPLSWWVSTGVTRWKDQFLKLRLFEMTQYDRILFVDADTLIRGKLDEIFNELEVQRPAQTLSNRIRRADEAPLPAQYMFAARSDNQLTGERRHPFPPLNTEVFSAGFWIAAPSQELFDYFLSILKHYRRFDPHTMEQSLLNYAFRRDGPMPWREMHYKWSATWPNSGDVEGDVVTLHEKFWKTGPQDLRKLWREQKGNMQRHFSKHNA